MKTLLKPACIILLFITSLHSQSNCTPIAEVNFPGGRVILSFDGNVHDDDDILALPYATGLWWAAGLKDKVVQVEYSNHVCLINVNESDGAGAGAGDDSQNMRNSASGAISRFDYDPNIFFDYETQGHASTNKMAFEIEKSTGANPLWIIAGGPMETIWRGLELASKGHENVIIISHSAWNENHSHCGDAHDWNAIKNKYSDRGVYFVGNCSGGDCLQPGGLNDQNGGFSSALSNWSWMQNSTKEYNRWIFGRNPFGNTKFDPSDAGMSYFLITGGPFNGGKKTANHNDAKKLMENPCQSIPHQVDNAIPLLSILSPLSGANPTAGSSVTINLSASDIDGYINKHQIFVNGTIVDTDGTNYSPYVISNISAGTYDLKATVTDNEGGTISKTVTLVVESASPSPPVPNPNPTPDPEPAPLPIPVPGNGMPNLSITSPGDGMIYNAGSTVSVNLTAADPDGDIRKYQIFVNNKLVDTDGTNYTPYKLNNLANGTYTIKAIVTDNDGNTISDSVVFNVQEGNPTENIPENGPPSNGTLPLLTITSPTANKEVLPGSNVTVSIAASTPNSRIVKHQIFVNGKLVDTDGTSFTPHKIVNISSGSHVIKATVTDANGASASQSITIKATTSLDSEETTTPVSNIVNSLPTVAFITPRKNQNYNAGSTVIVDLNATDNDGSIVKYQVFVNGKLVDTDGSFFTPHRITNVKAGNHVISAKVTDNKGATATQSTSFNVMASTQKQATDNDENKPKDAVAFNNGDLEKKNGPAVNFLRVSVNPVKDGRLLIYQKGNHFLRIMDMHGVTIKELDADQTTLEIDMSGVAPGMYLLSSDISVAKFILY